LKNEGNFNLLDKISEVDKIGIIKTEFRLKSEGEISFQKYYEGTEENSLFQL
jgi:hypothetical protein